MMRCSSVGMKCPKTADPRDEAVRDCPELGREGVGTDCAAQVEAFSGLWKRSKSGS